MKQALLAATFVLATAMLWGQATPNPPSPPCSTCVSGGGTAGTFPIFGAGTTAKRGIVTDSTLTGDADGNLFLGPQQDGFYLGSVTGKFGSFIGDMGGVIGWETHLDPDLPLTGVIGQLNNTNGAGVTGIARAASGNASGVNGRSRSPQGIGVIGVGGPVPTESVPVPQGEAIGVSGRSTTTMGVGVLGLSVDNTGVIGRVTSQTRLNLGVSVGVLGETLTTDGLTEGVSSIVYSPMGTAAVFRNRGGGDILVGEGPNEMHKFRFDGQGNLFLVGNLFANAGADLAERIDSQEMLQAGDVVELDPTTIGIFRKSRTALSTRVAGIISSKPAVTLGDTTGAEKNASRDTRPVLALAGTTRVNVTNEAGPITLGDLLTTSSTPGYAMRCADRVACVGAIVGKAMEPMSQATGVIRALITLQ